MAWLSKRLGTTLRAPKLDAEGLSLVGGRLLPAEGTTGQAAPAAQGSRAITVSVQPAREGPRPAGAPPEHR